VVTNEFSQGLAFESRVRPHTLSFASRWPRDGQEKGIRMFKASVGSGTGSCTVSERSVQRLRAIRRGGSEKMSLE